MTLAQLRTLRLALGTTLCLVFSQMVGWSLSYLAPVITLSFLGLPLPALKPAAGIKFLVLLALTLAGGTWLLPTLLYYELAGILLFSLALFFTFYLTAKGGPAVLGSLLTISLALTAGIGTVSIDALLAIIEGVLIAATVGLLFTWLAHGLLPDAKALPWVLPPGAKRPSKPPPPPLALARFRAVRSLVIVLPIVSWLVVSGSSASYVAVLIKVASMGQQATVAGTSKAARSLLGATLIGGIGAVLGWQVLSIWPSLVMYALVVALAGLVMGKRLFAGPALSATGPMWSYGYLTMIVILAPAVMDSAGGSEAGAAFWSRILMFAGATVYSVIAVTVFDAFFTRPAPATQTAGTVTVKTA